MSTVRFSVATETALPNRNIFNLKSKKDEGKKGRRGWKEDPMRDRRTHKIEKKADVHKPTETTREDRNKVTEDGEQKGKQKTTQTKN